MALNQSALLQLLAELKLTDTTDRIRQMTERGDVPCGGVIPGPRASRRRRGEPSCDGQ